MAAVTIKSDSKGEYVQVVKGNTLYGIANDSTVKSKTGGASYQQLAEWNNIANPNKIYVGQKIYLKKVDSSSSSDSTNKTNPNAVVITAFGLQSDAEGVLFATWTWSKEDKTEEYRITWEYYVDDSKTWFIGNDGSNSVDEHYRAASRQTTYTIPENASQVRLRIKPISKEKSSSGNKKKYYWTADWCDWQKFTVKDNIAPGVPATPSVEIKAYTLTATISDGLGELEADSIKFEVIKNDTTRYKTGTVTINESFEFVLYSCTIEAGHNYKVRCKAIRGKLESDWCAPSGNEQAIPSAPAKITSCRLVNANAIQSQYTVELKWEAVKSAESYKIEYTKVRDNFNIIGSDVTTVDVTKSDSDTVPPSTATIMVTEGGEYFFRVCAVNDKGSSEWSEIHSVKIGKEPAAPTTWSSVNTVVIGEKLYLYWVHNTEDGSSQTYAVLRLVINGHETTYEIHNFTDDSKKDKTRSCYIDTNTNEVVWEDDTGVKKSHLGTNLSEGVKMEWQVCTMGVINKLSEYSDLKTVDVYAPPSLELLVTDDFETDANGDIILGSTQMDVLEKFPFYVNAIASPETQKPIGYHVSIIANETYETVDQIGNTQTIVAGDEVYSKYFDIDKSLMLPFSAGNIDLENSISYTLRCTVSMNSGLTADASHDFTVSWQGIQYSPNAEIAIDEDTYSASIRPYCEDTEPYCYTVESNIDITNRITEVSNVYTTAGERVYLGIQSNREIYYCISYVDSSGSATEPTYYKVNKNNSGYARSGTKLDNTTIQPVYSEPGDEILLGILDGNEIEYCNSTKSSLAPDVTLSVYRREFDGSFTEIATGLDNSHNTFVTDPHPALDYARYRVVAKTNDTGAVSYYDLPGHLVGCKEIIIQWDEAWSSFNNWSEDPLSQPSWAGSLLRLPYDIDVSDSNDIDVTAVKYIGRKRPVTYYGTQLGETSTWNTTVVKDDEETIYALRRLAIWTGDVYVRVPTGTGYWANDKVSFSQKHCDMTIPVTLTLTRVEGGI